MFKRHITKTAATVSSLFLLGSTFITTKHAAAQTTTVGVRSGDPQNAAFGVKSGDAQNTTPVKRHSNNKQFVFSLFIGQPTDNERYKMSSAVDYHFRDDIIGSNLNVAVSTTGATGRASYEAHSQDGILTIDSDSFYDQSGDPKHYQDMIVIYQENASPVLFLENDNPVKLQVGVDIAMSYDTKFNPSSYSSSSASYTFMTNFFNYSTRARFNKNDPSENTPRSDKINAHFDVEVTAYSRSRAEDKDKAYRYIEPRSFRPIEFEGHTYRYYINIPKLMRQYFEDHPTLPIISDKVTYENIDGKSLHWGGAYWQNLRNFANDDTIASSFLSQHVVIKAKQEQPTQVEDLPDIMDSIGWPTAARLMRLWMSRPQQYANGNPATNKLDLNLPVIVRNIPLTWLLDPAHNQNRAGGGIDQTYQQAFERSYSPATLITTEHYKEILKQNPQIEALRKGQSCTFGNYQTSQFATNPIAFYKKYTTQRSGPTLHGPKPMLSEAFAAIGDTTFWIAPKGTAQRKANGEIELYITQVGVYYIDSYDFNGHYPLGLWKKPNSVDWPQLEGSTFIKQFKSDNELLPSTYTMSVSKDSFQRYREDRKTGGDFLIIPENLRMIILTQPIKFTYNDAVIRETVQHTPNRPELRL